MYRIRQLDGAGRAVSTDWRGPRLRDLAAWYACRRPGSRNSCRFGAAGALAAAFNTPVAAVIFALEEIIGDMNATLLGSTVVASVASVIVERSILGNEPLFRVPTYHLVHPGELGAYAVLGIVGGVVSVVFCKLLLGARLAFRRLPAFLSKRGRELAQTSSTPTRIDLRLVYQSRISYIDIHEGGPPEAAQRTRRGR